MKKKKLEIQLSKLKPNLKPKLNFEGYPLDARSAAEICYIAEYIHRDINNKRIIDLGCGSCILSIGALLLNAKHVVGVDIDSEAIKIAKKNVKKVDVELDLIIGDIKCIIGKFDTTLMNPPFGSRQRGADIKFLKQALNLSKIVYSLHKLSKSAENFFRKKIPLIGGKIDKIYPLEIKIPHTYDFHKKKFYPIKVILLRTISTKI